MWRVLQFTVFVIGALLLLGTAPWSGWFILGLVLDAVTGLSYLPDILDNVDW